MTPKEKHRFIKEVFNTALELEPAERIQYIKQACNNDSVMISEVEALLASEAEEKEFIGGLSKEITGRLLGSMKREDTGLIGKTIKDRFRIEQELGGGGMGDVYLGVDEKDGQTRVVIKILKRQPDQEVQNWLEVHFSNEARALARIDHPAVVKLIDAGEIEDGKPFFVMEYVQGTNLRSEIEACRGLKGGFERIARIMCQLGDAVGIAHQLGIYHRDLKPENILLQQGESEQVKIIDFGLATVKDLYDEKTKATMFAAGSVCYVAPEQFKKKPGSTSDIYALGMIAYEMVTGRLPFEPKKTEYAEAIYELIRLQEEGVKIKPRNLCFDLPQRAEEAILKALSYNPKDRYKKAKEFTDELVAALTEKREIIEDRINAAATTIKLDLKPRQSEIKKILQKIFLAATVIITVAAGTVSIIKLTSSRANRAIDATHSINYWAMLQRYDKRQQLIGRPLRLISVTGQTYANKGDGITLHFISEENGYLYVFDESIPDESRPRGDNKEHSYSILFPTPNANNGEAKLRGGEEATAVEGLFDEESATERIWIIWSAKEESELTEIIKNTKQGEISGADAERMSRYIESRQSQEIKAEADKEKKMMCLRFEGEAMVYAMEIAHVGN